ncbi:hypothetical protein I4U23_015386 [Adineta vaga]|nr:hypothetical protein I4U23_015386 [Adineta vaga]
MVTLTHIHFTRCALLHKPLKYVYGEYNGTCDHDTCQCDKVAVECFLRHRNTTYDRDFNNWKGLCTKTSNEPSDDPQRCPPVWNKKTKYMRNNLVSINGIVYQYLQTNNPGENPKKKLPSMNILEREARWKKLKRCRRMDIVNDF